MTRNIKATAIGSPYPSTVEGGSVVNEDFLISPNRILIDGKVIKTGSGGDGIDEETSWIFYFSEDPNFSLFSLLGTIISATLTLTLTPKHEGISTDFFWIDTLPIIFINTIIPDIEKNPRLNTTITITVNLLNTYSSSDIMRVLANSLTGRIPMHYNDDAIISFAQLELSQSGD